MANDALTFQHLQRVDSGGRLARPWERTRTHSRSSSAPDPCTGCKFAARCGAELLCCERFGGYIAGEPEWRWRRFPMAPSRARYEAVFDRRHETSDCQRDAPALVRRLHP